MRKFVFSTVITESIMVGIVIEREVMIAGGGGRREVRGDVESLLCAQNAQEIRVLSELAMKRCGHSLAFLAHRCTACALNSTVAAVARATPTWRGNSLSQLLYSFSKPHNTTLSPYAPPPSKHSPIERHVSLVPFSILDPPACLSELHVLTAHALPAYM